MFNSKPKIYIMRAMTGQNQADVVKTAKEDRKFFESAGVEVLCPVDKENVKSLNIPLKSDKEHMDIYWPTDKKMMREANLCVNMSPHLASMGVIREYGYCRYFLWKKVISVFPIGKLPSESSVIFYEDDDVVDTREMALESILRTHGTLLKRLLWRFSIYKKSFLKSCYYKLMEWK